MTTYEEREQAIQEHLLDYPDNVRAAIDVLVRYGSEDGSHHKMWVIDQALRALVGEGYDPLITAVKSGENDTDTYEWDEGIAP